MKKFTRRFFKVLGIFVLLLIAAMIIIPIAFKKQIAEKVKEEANKNINAKMDFTDYGLSLFRNFPNFSLRLDGLNVVGIDEFKEDTLADVSSLYASVDLMSVFKGDQYKINSITLEDPKLLLKVLKNGKANWDIAKPSEDTTAAKKEEEPSEPSAMKIALKKFAIHNAQLVYDDRSAGNKIVVKNLDHTLKGDLSADYTSIDSKTEIEELTINSGGVNYLNKGELEIDVDVDADLANSVYTLKDNRFRINALVFGLDGYVSMNNDIIGMDLKFNAEKAQFKEFLSLVPGIYAKDFEDIETKGSLAMNGYAKGSYSENTLPAFALNIMIDNAMFQYPDLPGAVENININTKIENKGGSPDNTVININKFHVEMGGNPVDIKMMVTTPVSDPNIDGHIKGKVNLAKVNEFYPLEENEDLSGIINTNIKLKGNMSSIEKENYEEFTAEGRVEISKMSYESKDFPQGVKIHKAIMNASPQYFSLDAFDSKIGKSDFYAKGRIDNILAYVFKDELLKGSFTATSNLLDLNEFMSESDAEEPVEEEGGETTSSEMSVLEVPGNIQFNLKSNFKKVLYADLEMTNVIGNIEVKDSKAMLKNLSFNALDGKMVINGAYSTQNPEVPSVDFNLGIYNFNIQKTYKTFTTVRELAPVAEKTKGNFSSQMSYYADLDATMMPVTESMAGKGYIESSKIVIENYKPMVKISEALKMDQFKTLTMQGFRFNFEFSDGRVTIEPFDMGLKGMTAMFGGSTMLDGGMDYLLSAEIPREKFGSAANQVVNGLVSKAKNKGINVDPGDMVYIDAKITGTADDPKVNLSIKSSNEDMMGDIKDQVEEKIKDEAKKVIDKGKEEAEKLKKEAEEKLRKEKEKAKKEMEKKKKEAEEKAKKEKEKQKKKAKEKIKKKFPF